MPIGRKSLERFLNSSKHEIPFGGIIKKIEVQEREGGTYAIRIIPLLHEVKFEQILFVPMQRSGSEKKEKAWILKQISAQEDRAVGPYAEIIREKTAAALEKWKKGHPIKKGELDFLESREAWEYIPESTRRALVAAAAKELSCDRMKMSYVRRTIHAEIPGFPYAAEYVPEIKEYRSPFRAMNTWYKKIGILKEAAKTMEGVRKYISEKGYPAYAAYDKDAEDICITFRFGEHTAGRHINAVGAYKNAVRRAFREAKAECDEFEKIRNDAVINNPYYGTVLADAILCTVEENRLRRTPQQICDILRGVRLKEEYVFGEYSGKFTMFRDEDIKAAISTLCDTGMLTKKVVKGTYQEYTVIRTSPDTGLFRSLQAETDIRKPKTELDYTGYIRAAVSGNAVIPKDRYASVAGMIASSPGIFCKDPEAVMDFAENLTPDIIAGLIRKYKDGQEKQSASAAVVRYMAAAAKRKRKKLPPNGIEILNEKKEKKRLAEIEREKREQEIMDRVLTEIPSRYVDLYPLARMMKRKFILHLGPTNSGKTYMAIEDLMKAERGIYLAPLRLLAFEQYEKMNSNGCPCSLITGEEQAIVDGALHQSSTIEMLNTRSVYDVAVIDEAQMIADDNRGGAWAAAIMGVRADTVHVCAALEAEELLKKIISDCGDEYTVIKHERMTPLVCEKKKVKFPDGVRKGDALIVFSRKSVHAVASTLQKRRVKCSIIYGALPYDVRHAQAEKFQNGETDVVVATDAIGMGMNLPIKRVVLMEMEKFDGTRKRPLLGEEIRQIAGRAGRYGVYDVGYAASESGDRRVAAALAETPKQLTEAVIGFPEILINIDATMVELIGKWMQVLPERGWKKESVEEMLRLAVIVQGLHAPKKLEYDFLTIPFDDEDEELLAIWYDFFRKEAAGQEYDISGIVEQMDIEDGTGGAALAVLEKQHAALDLYFNIARKFQPSENTAALIMDKKRICSERIIKILEKQKLRGKTCKYCGRELPWNYPYGICERCYEMRRYF